MQQVDRDTLQVRKSRSSAAKLPREEHGVPAGKVTRERYPGFNLAYVLPSTSRAISDGSRASMIAPREERIKTLAIRVAVQVKQHFPRTRYCVSTVATNGKHLLCIATNV